MTNATTEETLTIDGIEYIVLDQTYCKNASFINKVHTDCLVIRRIKGKKLWTVARFTYPTGKVLYGRVS